MLDWISYYEPNKNIKPINDQKALDIKRISLDPINYLNEIAMMFIAGSIMLSEDMMVSLSIRNEKSRNAILNEVAPHFHETKLVYFDYQLAYINMRIVRDSSKELFFRNNSIMLQLVKDLYRTTDMKNWSTPVKRKIQYYQVIKDKMESLEMKELNQISDYIMKEYFEYNEELVLIPTGWKLQDELKASLFLRSFSNFVPTIDLLVDESNNEVIAIELKK